MFLAPIYPEEKYKTLAIDVRNSLLHAYHATLRQDGTVLCKKKKRKLDCHSTVFFREIV